MLEIEGFEHCILGLCESADGIFRLAYSSEMILDTLVADHNMTYDQAQDFFERSFLDCPGDRQSPVFVTQCSIDYIHDLVEVANKAIK